MPLIKKKPNLISTWKLFAMIFGCDIIYNAVELYHIQNLNWKLIFIKTSSFIK